MFLCFRISGTSLLPLQVLVARSRKKSQFLREQKAEWDRLSEEARLRADMAAQLAAAQEREAQACQDAEEAHGMFEDLSARSKLDGEEIARLKKERDELLQRNATVNEKTDEVLKELEMEREGLDIRISTMLEALDQARGALREIVVPTTQVSA